MDNEDQRKFNTDKEALKTIRSYSLGDLDYRGVIADRPKPPSQTPSYYEVLQDLDFISETHEQDISKQVARIRDFIRWAK